MQNLDKKTVNINKNNSDDYLDDDNNNLIIDKCYNKTSCYSSSSLSYHHKNHNKLLKHNNNNNLKRIKCTCKPNQKHFNCLQCTQSFPINVRRSKDGEEDEEEEEEKKQNLVNYFFLADNNSNEKSSLQNTIINLKPTPIPVSSTLMSLLALNKPGNTFIPPPNKCISTHLHKN